MSEVREGFAEENEEVETRLGEANAHNTALDLENHRLSKAKQTPSIPRLVNLEFRSCLLTPRWTFQTANCTTRIAECSGTNAERSVSLASLGF